MVIVGGGFAGLYAAKNLARNRSVAVTLVDRRNFHLFQPLLYQVATGALSPGEIAQPLRSIVRKHRNTTVLLGEAVGLDPDQRQVLMGDGGPIDYDTLVVATGARHAYFGHDEWAPFAPGLKTIEDAFEMRRRILIAFEAAEREADPEIRREWMTFVVVGGGPTGVELAGALGEIANDTLRRDFRRIHPPDSRILLIEALDVILPTYPEKLSRSAAKQLERLGVTVSTGTKVTGIDEHGVMVAHKDGSEERIPARTVLWAAGVQAASFGRMVADATGSSRIERAGSRSGRTSRSRATRRSSWSATSRSRSARTGVPCRAWRRRRSRRARTWPARSAGALAGEPSQPFRYTDKGDVATIGRLRGVANIGWLGPFGQLSGFLAWAMWLGIHILYLIGFANRIVVTIRWAWSFFTRGRSTRLITGEWSRLLPPIEEPDPPVTPAEVGRGRAGS